MLDPAKHTIADGFDLIRAKVRKHPFFFLSYFCKEDPKVVQKNEQLNELIAQLNQIQNKVQEILNEETN